VGEIERRIARGKINAEAQGELWDALYLTIPEIDELITYVRNPKLPWAKSDFPCVSPMFVFAAHTGARRSEMMRSRIEDIDFDAGEVHIREKKRDRSKVETMRRVPLTAPLREALQTWFALHPGGPLTFCKTAGEAVTAQMMHHYLRWTLDQSKWKVVRGWHTFRHSFISNLASQGISERIIMELAGHVNPATSRRYAHLIPSTVSDAMQVVFGNRKHSTVLLPDCERDPSPAK
jgi:integrase